MLKALPLRSPKVSISVNQPERSSVFRASFTSWWAKRSWKGRNDAGLVQFRPNGFEQTLLRPDQTQFERRERPGLWPNLRFSRLRPPILSSATTKPDLLRIMMLDCSSVRHGVQGSRASLAAFGVLDTAPHCAGGVTIIFFWRSLCSVSRLAVQCQPRQAPSASRCRQCSFGVRKACKPKVFPKGHLSWSCSFRSKRYESGSANALISSLRWSIARAKFGNGSI